MDVMSPYSSYSCSSSNLTPLLASTFFYLEHTIHRQINLTGVLQKVKGRPKLTISLALWATHPNISISSRITAATFSNISNYCRQLPAIRQNSPQCRRPSCSSAGGSNEATVCRRSASGSPGVHSWLHTPHHFISLLPPSPNSHVCHGQPSPPPPAARPSPTVEMTEGN